MKSQQTELDLISTIRDRVANQKPKVLESKKGVDKQEAMIEGEYMLRKMMKEKRPKTHIEAQMFINACMMDIMKYFKQVGADVTKDEFLNYLKEKANG